MCTVVRMCRTWHRSLFTSRNCSTKSMACLRMQRIRGLRLELVTQARCLVIQISVFALKLILLISSIGFILAWFRLKFPHLTRGSISSSGVVHAILAYPQFDEQVMFVCHTLNSMLSHCMLINVLN